MGRAGQTAQNGVNDAAQMNGSFVAAAAALK
jgi:hypothetical protein